MSEEMKTINYFGRDYKVPVWVRFMVTYRDVYYRLSVSDCRAFLTTTQKSHGATKPLRIVPMLGAIRRLAIQWLYQSCTGLERESMLILKALLGLFFTGFLIFSLVVFLAHYTRD